MVQTGSGAALPFIQILVTEHEKRFAQFHEACAEYVEKTKLYDQPERK